MRNHLILLFALGGAGCGGWVLDADVENQFQALNDVDGDGVMIDDDCDDADESLGSTSEDADCDGVLSADDCDDNDPSTVNDMDCDGVLTADDCDDTDADSTEISTDADCDGVLSADDCDDNDPGTVNDMDCDDSDAASTLTATDADCDGVLTGADCDDANPAMFPGNVEVCDGLDNDCDSATNEQADGDGDGFSVCDGDCDDNNPASIVLGLSVTVQGSEYLGVCGGSFQMGCTSAQQSDGNCDADESPVHTVELTHSFWIGETEVTQGQWQALMGNNPSDFGTCGTDCPVENVEWYEALVFANAVSLAEGLAECYTVNGTSVSVNSPTGSIYDCDGYRLPTEAEWEYAARAGTDLLYAGSNTVGDVAWYGGNSASSTHPVATKQPNDWGLYDMSGNVYEWAWDWYDSSYYSVSPSTDPEGPSSGSTRVKRGSYYSTYYGLRVADRSRNSPDYHNYRLGFRLTRTGP